MAVVSSYRRRSVKSDNERDPYRLLLNGSRFRRTIADRWREVRGRWGQRQVSMLRIRWATRATKARTMGLPRREAALSRNLVVVRIEGCNSPS